MDDAAMRHLENGPLAGIRVLEIGSSVSGPFCGRILADFGAEVIKVEPPEGDPVRHMGEHVDGKSLYAASIFRNKSLVSIDLRSDAGRALILKLAATADVLVENFKPGTMERWGLDFNTLSRDNPGLVMVRISGFGQTGPYKHRAGYGVIGEAMSGLRHLTGEPDRPPSRINASVTDEVTGIYAALGAVAALRARSVTGKGQCVDATLFESAFSLTEPHVPAYGKLGIVAGREGSRLSNSTPNNLYRARDRRYIHICAMSDSVFRRLAEAMEQPGLSSDARFRTARDRNANAEVLDDLIETWTRGRDLADLEQLLHGKSVPASRIYNIADVYADSHYRERDALIEAADPDLGTVTVPGVFPRLSATPGRVRHLGKTIGEDTRAILRSLCGLSDAEVTTLATEHVVRDGGSGSGAISEVNQQKATR